MNDKDPSTYVTPASSGETETNHNQDPTADLREIARHIDEVLEADTQGERTSAANYDPYGPKVEHAVGDRYGENVRRTTDNDRVSYSVAYSTAIEAPQPDPTKPGLDPYNFRETRYTFDLNADGTVGDLVKGGGLHLGKLEGGEKVADEAAAEAVADIKKVIADGLEKNTLRADSQDLTRPTVEVGAQPTEAARPKTLLGRMAAGLGLRRKQ